MLQTQHIQYFLEIIQRKWFKENVIVFKLCYVRFLVSTIPYILRSRSRILNFSYIANQTKTVHKLQYQCERIKGRQFPLLTQNISFRYRLMLQLQELLEIWKSKCHCFRIMNREVTFYFIVTVQRKF